MVFAWQQAGFKPVEIEIQPSQEIEDGWELEASEETEREAWAILPQDTVNFVAELAVARDNESTIINIISSVQLWYSRVGLCTTHEADGRG